MKSHFRTAALSAETNRSFLASIVVPVYNVELYLADAIDSVIGQTIGFSKNVQLILVDDGSTDSSGELCQHYRQKYPENVVYIHQQHTGVSAARNAGVAEATGKYVGFLDGDDKYSSTALQKAIHQFTIHDVDLVAIKKRFFDTSLGIHPLYENLTHDTIIDIAKSPELIYFSATGSFIRRSALEQAPKGFDEALTYNEDVTLIIQIIRRKNRYAFVADPTYYYRKRASPDSLNAQSVYDQRWYAETLRGAHRQLVTMIGDHPTVARWLQHILFYDIVHRLNQKRRSILTDDNKQEYIGEIQHILEAIDDDIISSALDLTAAMKRYALELKHGEVPTDFKTPSAVVHLELIKHDDESFYLEGYVSDAYDDNAQLELHGAESIFVADHVNRPHKAERFLGEVIHQHNGFSVKIPRAYSGQLRAIISGSDDELQINTYRNSHLSTNRNSYRVIGQTIITYKKPRMLQFEDYSLIRAAIHEIIYWPYILRQLRLGYIKDEFKRLKIVGREGLGTKLFIRQLARAAIMPLKSMLLNLAVILTRVSYFASKPFIRQKIWVVSDRVKSGGDNGEAMFKYIMSRADVPANVYFMLSKSSKDYARMTQIGNVVDPKSLLYKFLLLHADKVISSQANDIVMNAFRGREHDVIDLYTFDLIFLQHGIIKDDLSRWLNRYNRNIQLFVTSAYQEYESILAESYHYDKSVVKLTGLPRYDYLKNTPKGKLILAPTWRENLVLGEDVTAGVRPYAASFKLSSYYQFYNDLMNDRRVRDVLEAHNMTGELYLHPALARQIKDFTSNERFSVKDIPYDYRTAFSEGNVMVTDYSSVAFDFAYLKKPVIYSQFDQANFYDGHSYDQGYFSYDEHGLGPVTTSYEATVSEIVKTIEDGCAMSQKYLERAENFFYKFDQNNAERVYEAMLEQDS